MKKIVMIFSVMILTFSLFGQNFIHAASQQYDNIEVGDYDIIAKALNADSDDQSGAAGFIEENGTLKVGEDEIELTLTIPHNDMASIQGMQVEGVEASIDGDQWTFKIATLKPLLDAQVQYEVPALDMKHDVPFRFSLEGLEDLPVQEEPEVEEPEIDENEESTEEDDDVKELNNGFYTVDAAYLHASKDEPSSMGNYLSKSVFLNVQDDKIEMTIAVNDHQTVSKLQIDEKDSISAKLDGNTRYETFEIDSLEESVLAYVEYQAPFGGSIHYGNATFRVDVDLTELKKSSENEQPGHGISAEYLNVEDGLYSIDASYINAKNGQNSAMANYLGDKAYISVKEGKTEIFFIINDNSTVTKLKINDQEGTEEKVNGKITLESFDLESLITKMSGYAEYEASYNGETHYGKAEFDISLNKDTIKKENQLPVENEQPKEDEKEEETPKPETPKPETPKPETPKEEKPEPESKDPAVKGYTFDYMVKHATEDEVSAADNFFVKPGVLLKKDGKNYLQISIKNWSMIDWIKVSGKSVTVIEEDKENDTAIVQFHVSNNLDEIFQLSMKVTVPGLYETEHEARLILDSQSVVEDESDEEYVVYEPEEENTQIPTPEKESKETDEEPEAIQKPGFETNHTEEQISAKQSTMDKHANPQTGDHSKIVLYSMLLLVSLALLAIQYRKRQINT